MGQFSPGTKSNCPPCDAAAKQLKQITDKTFARARFLPDGSLVYPKKGFEPPPPIEGYERDKGNKWRFIPLWPDCKTRARMLQLKKCGAYSVTMVCTNQECPLLQQGLGIQDCNNCRFRQPTKDNPTASEQS